LLWLLLFFFQAEDGIRDLTVTGVQTCALPILARIFKDVDIMIVPSLRDEQLTITNFTGHPSLTMRAGFVDIAEARSDWAPDPARSEERRVGKECRARGRTEE